MLQAAASTYIDRKLPPNPNQLRRIRLKLLDTARMRFANVYSIFSKRVNDLEVMTKHVRMLVIFGVDVLTDRQGEGELR